MSGSDEARDAIRKLARAIYGPVYTAGTAYAKAHQALVAETDLVATMGYAIDLVLAAEHLQEMAAEAEKSARTILAHTMNDTGCPQIQTKAHTAYLSRKPAFVSISDESAIPERFFVQPPPSLDKRALAAALKGGEKIDGASLATPNEPQLNIRQRKDIAA